MAYPYDLVAQLTSSVFDPRGATRLLTDFSDALGWTPSDHFEVPHLRDFANAHLLVEHGLENTAVITFLKSPWHVENLTTHRQLQLLNISYNNLVDWHLQVDSSSVCFIYNRTKPHRLVDRLPISRETIDTLHSETFESVSGRRPIPNLPALDDALINTISEWKRSLSAEMGYQIANDALSALFNSLIFVRATEDYHHRTARNLTHSNGDDQTGILLAGWNAGRDTGITLRELINESLSEFIQGDIPRYLIDSERLRAFDQLHPDTVAALLIDFYRNRFAPYEYDFSVMSKHALSRVYEHYVSLLHLDLPSHPQLALFPQLPEEERNRAFGSVYTPQFIARFFARYLRDRLPPPLFQHLKSIDPACGSGIFLRTLLELQCDPTRADLKTKTVEEAFQRTMGIDVDPNACHAASLSLALLHLVLTGNLPNSLNIQVAEATAYLDDHPELKGQFDAVLANPPFVPLDIQSDAMRARIRKFMGTYASGRTDLYLAFLLAGLRMLKPGGFGLFVLPHSFLLGENANKIRSLIVEEAWIHCLADLSAIRIFEASSSYVVLLIFQKKDPRTYAPPATIIRCQDQVSRALQDAADGVQTHTPSYDIYAVDQDQFKSNEWVLLPPREVGLEQRLRSMAAIGDFMKVRLGFTSGMDKVFIVPEHARPEGEHSLFRPFLPDREMLPYTVPARTSLFVFYPYTGTRRLLEDELRTGFPKTWAYLEAHKAELEGRRPVRSGARPWWLPHRSPVELFAPKIVTPHLVLVPRFGLDRQGSYAVSHTPYLTPRTDDAPDDLLRFFLAVLNSTPCFWYISNHSHAYSRGYAMLECKTLVKTPVPDPRSIPPKDRQRVISLVEQRLTASGQLAITIEKEIDDLVASFYDLTFEERRAVGMEE